MSYVIGWFLARAIGKYFLTGPFRHTLGLGTIDRVKR